MKLEAVAPARRFEGAEVGLQETILDGGYKPVVVWAGFSTAHASKSGAFHSIAKPAPEPFDFADPTIAVIVKRGNDGPIDGLLERLERGAANRLFRPGILTLSDEVTSEDIGRLENLVHCIVNERYATLARRNMDLTRQLFEVRRVHEDLQAAFEQVEQYLHANGLNEPKLLLELPPVDAEGEVPSLKLSAATPVVLGLPYELNKIAGFSIQVRRQRRARRCQTRLLVTLTSGTADQIHGAWSTPVDRLPESGWFSFLLDRLSIDYGHTVRIAFQLDGEADVDLVLSAKPLLGASLMPRPAGSLETALHALPAFRLWRGLPGTRMAQALELQPLDFEHHGDGRSGRKILVHVGSDGVEQVHADEVASAPLVSFNADEHSIQVHPVARGMVVAKVRQALPRERFSIQATVGLHHEEASGVEFAMVVARNEEEALEALSGEATWMQATFSQHGPLTVECRASEDHRCLYLATRLPQGGTTKYAWARFRNLTVVL
jgi:hypothetical protein